MFEKYHCVKQHDITDYGAACLDAISIFKKRDFNEQTIFN